MAPTDYTMSPVAWLFISLFAGATLVIAIVYLHSLKIRRDKRKAIDKAENDEIFGNIVKHPIQAPSPTS
jgi:hypothetical protein